MVREPLLRVAEQLERRRVVAALAVLLGLEVPLPGRRGVHAGDAADREHGRAGLDRDGVAPNLRVADEDDRALRRVDLLAVERERGVADDHDVRLLMPERLLGVLLDDVVADRGRGVGVDPEGVDAERPAQRLPLHAGDGDRLDLGDPDDGVGL